MTDEPSTAQHAQGSYIAQATHGGVATVQVVLPPAPVQEQNRVRFLARLRYYYGELWGQSPQGAALMTLGLTEKPDAVLHHTELLFRSGQQPEHHLPPGTSILQVYDDCGQELLILGEPGAGKSTLLLDLARQLVERAEQDAGHPFPVILPLSSWAVKQQQLQDWLPAQLSLIYDVPLQLCRAWTLTDQILLLLDGLDEVPQGARAACMKAITDYRKGHLVPLVVCSRRAEYEKIERRQRLILHNAVVVEPLSRYQVETYLAQAGPALAAVRVVLHTNPVLQELMTTPLMLNVLTLTYIGAHAQDLPQRGSADAQQQQIFVSYLERMVELKGNRVCYPLQTTKAWLGWLARQTRQRNQTVFYLEHLQPDWLSVKQQRSYTQMAVRLPAIIIGILGSLFVTLLSGGSPITWPGFLQWSVLGGFLGWLWSESMSPENAQALRKQSPFHVWGKRIAISIFLALLVGVGFRFKYVFPYYGYAPSEWLYGGLIFEVGIGLGSLLLQSCFTRAPSSSPVMLTITHLAGRGSRLAHFLQTAIVQRAFLAASVCALSYAFGIKLVFAPVVKPVYTPSQILIYGLVYGWIYGCSSVLVGLSVRTLAGDIRLTERVKWTWRSLLRSLFAPKHLWRTLLLASCMMITNGLFNTLNGWSISNLDIALGIALSIALNYWLLFGLFLGIAQEQIDDQDRRLANQGIRRSLYNSMIMGIMSGGITGAISILLYMTSHGLLRGVSIYTLLSGVPIYALECGVSGACLVWLLTGGVTVLRHFLIRYFLWRTQTFPWRTAPFLDDATARIFLQRVGGGYRFAHRLILDFFASLDNPLTKPELPQPSLAVPPRICSACGYQEERPGGRFCAGCGKSLAS